MIFKKLKRNQNKIKPRGRKRKIFGSIILSFILLFGKPRWSSSQSSSPHFDFDNQVYQGRLLSDQEFNSFENNDRQVILVKTGDSAPSVPTSPGRGQPNSFPSGSTGRRRTPHVNPYRIPPRVVNQGLGAAANPAGAGNEGGAPEFEEECPVPKKEQSQKSKTFDYDYRSNDSKKKKQSEDQCPIYEQNKAGIDELPDSSEFIYNLETKTVKKALKKVWKNPEAKKEVLAGLDKMKKGELLPRNQKDLKGFKTLKEIKLNKSRMLVEPGKNGAPDTIVAIFMRRDMDDIVLAFKNKYK